MTSWSIGCFHCGHPINFHLSTSENDYACPNCGKYILTTYIVCWFAGCGQTVTREPQFQDGIYGYFCPNGHSLRRHPELGMGGSNDMAVWSSHQLAAIQHLMSLENPKNYAITKEMVYKWIVSDQAGKDEITKTLS